MSRASLIDCWPGRRSCRDGRHHARRIPYFINIFFSFKKKENDWNWHCSTIATWNQWIIVRNGKFDCQRFHFSTERPFWNTIWWGDGQRHLLESSNLTLRCIYRISRTTITNAPKQPENWERTNLRLLNLKNFPRPQPSILQGFLVSGSLYLLNCWAADERAVEKRKTRRSRSVCLWRNICLGNRAADAGWSRYILTICLPLWWLFRIINRKKGTTASSPREVELKRQWNIKNYV